MSRQDASGPLVFFSGEWWDAALARWNASAVVERLAGLGTIQFRVLDSEQPPVIIDWDPGGQARRCCDSRQPDLVLDASLENWWAFLQGEFKASQAILDGTIGFQGDVHRILPYSEAFNLLAQVANNTTLPASLSAGAE